MKSDGEPSRHGLESGIVVAAIPGLEERHVVARLNFDDPGVVLIFGLARHEAKFRAEMLHHKEGDVLTPTAHIGGSGGHERGGAARQPCGLRAWRGSQRG